MSNNVGKLVILEGACDGIGKSTQFELLKKRLLCESGGVVSHHFPSYGTYHGEPVTRYLKGEYGEVKDLSSYFINSLYAVDRGVYWHTELKKHFFNGKTILLDRLLPLV